MPTSFEPFKTGSGTASWPPGPRATPPAEQRAFYPERSDFVWIVELGSVDLFCQKMMDGEYGARRHLASFSAGQAIFGIDLQQHGGLSLIAAMHPGTTARCLSKAVFLRQNTLSAVRSPAVLVESWVHALYAACALPAPLRALATLGTGQKLEAGSGPLAIGPQDTLCWVRPSGGSALLYGTAEWPADGGVLPLSRHGDAWLELSAGGTAEAVDFDEVGALDPAWNWLDAFHDLALACLLKRWEAQETGWRAALAHQRSTDALLAHHALKGLAAPLARETAHAFDVSTQKDPLLSACKALEFDLGIEFKAVPERTDTLSFRHAVEAIARASAIRQRRVALRGDWWNHDCGPMLAMHKETKRPMSLAYRSSGHYDCFDPVERSWQRVTVALAAQLQSAAYLFYRRFPLRALGARDLMRLVLGASRRDLTRVLVMGAAGGLLSLAFPIAVGVVFDSVIPGAERGRLLGLAAMLIAVAVSAAAFGLVRGLSVLRAEARIDAVAQSSVWDRLLRLPAPFFRRFSSGDLALRSLAINQIRNILTNSTLSALLSGVFSLFTLLLLFYYNARLGWLAVALTAALLAAGTGSALAQLRYARQVARLRGRISSTLLQFMNGISKLRVSGAEQRAYSVWAQQFAEQKRLYLKARSIANAFAVFRSVYPLVAMGLLFYLAGPDVHGRPVSGPNTGVFLAFLAAFLQFLTTSIQFTSVFPSLVSVAPVFERLLPILETPPEVEEGRPAPGTLRGSVEVSHVHFRYDALGPPVLRDISFVVHPGEFVAFTGQSGSGKSTLLRLLLGFETPESGTVAYDDQDIRGIDVQALRHQIGVVLQSGRLVSGSILDNIIGSLPLTQDDAWEAARMAGLDRDIKEMPMGLHTFVNDGGAGLSGGQRQRLMIARAIVNKPRILFFDEATSALDNYTQSVVGRSLETLRATRIVIAHRLSTIQQADRIYVFERGSIVQTGTFEELKRKPGAFQTLVQRQTV